MSRTLGLILGLAAAAALPLACGDSSSSTFNDGNGDDGGGSSSSGSLPPDFGGDGSTGGDGTTPNGGVTITSMRIDPPDATITVTPPAVATQAYRVLAVLNGQQPEVDITSRAVFYVPDNYLVGGFPLNGGPLFSSNATDPRGGKLTVQAQAASSNGQITTVTTSLTVKLLATLTSPNATPAIPPSPGSLFGGSPDAARAPKLFYPNDGVMLPPNLHRL
jgi:hypothetical protein